jgi:single-strand DNA-binding protein
MSYHRTIIEGFLGRDPEMRFTGTGDPICKFSVAVTEKGKNGTEETTWYPVVIFGKQAESAGEHLRKGSGVLIEGRIKTNEYDKDGQKIKTWYLHSDRWIFPSVARAEQRQAQQSEPATASAGGGFDDFEDDRPF